MTRFIDTLAHPSHRALAEAIIDGADEASLVAEYGSTRVAEMRRRISDWEKGKKKFIRAVGCATCRA